jgi:hypothetical protein
VAQRGTSSTSDSWQTIDRFRNNHAGGVTQSQETLTSSDTPYTLGFRKFFRQTVTSTSTSAAQNVQIFQPMEAQNVANSGWNYTSPTSYITCSFWVRSSLAGTYNIELRTYDGTGQLYASDFTIAANTWTKIEKTVPGNSNITIDNDAGQGLQFNVIAHYGTDFTDSGHTMDAWAPFSGSSRRTDMAQSWINTASATFDVTGVQVEVGSNASDFEHKSYADVLRECYRYYWELSAARYGTNTFLPFNIWMESTGAAKASLMFPVDMRDSPTIANAAGGTWYCDGGTSGNPDLTWLGVSSTTTNAARVEFTGSFDARDGGSPRYKNSSAKLSFDAEF